MVDPVGFVFLVFGVPSAIWPYRLAKFGEQLDAIGSTRSWSEVEPADWNVALTRVIGIGMSLFGLLILFGG